jgi:REP element-mobilizing transposase RayT
MRLKPQFLKDFRLNENLPHISKYGYYQFVTFRTYESVDTYLQSIVDSNIENSKKQYLIDNYLDSSHNGRYLNDKVLKLSKDYILAQDKILFELIAFIIMPNHIHILFKETVELSEAIRKLKGGLSFLINKELNRKGQFWANNYYDKMIRDEKHFGVVYKYIKNNAIKADLKDSKYRFYTKYD